MSAGDKFGGPVDGIEIDNCDKSIEMVDSPQKLNPKPRMSSEPTKRHGKQRKNYAESI